MIFVSWINGQKEYCLSSAQILTSRYQSIVDNGAKIECTSNVADVMGIFHSHSLHCPLTHDQSVCFQSVLEELGLGGKGFFPYYQSNTEISFSNRLLKPNELSNDHQTNAVPVLVNDDFEDRIQFCRIQLLHHIL